MPGKLLPHVPGFYNFTGRNLRRWQAAQYAVKSGVRNAQIACIGDSTTAGVLAAPGPSSVGAMPFSWPAQLAGLLPKASQSSIWASNNQGAAFDPRIAVTGGFAVASINSLGGPYWQTTVAGKIAFTPPNPVDTFVLYYPTNPVFGHATFDLDGGATTAIDETPAISWQKLVFTTTLGTHTANFTWVSGTVEGAQIIAYNSLVPEISVYNMGWGSAVVSNWAAPGSGYAATNAMVLLGADLYIIDLTINDANGGVSPLLNQQGINFMISQARKAGGDVILMCGNPTSSTASLDVQWKYVSNMQMIAYENNVPFISPWPAFNNSWTLANAQGLMGDTLHPTSPGYAKIAALVNRALAPGFLSR